MNEIKQLSLCVANQIAAGEVVERPLSVIKELLENALDANATSIIIDIEKGGLTLCRVRDNGDGIAKAQLPLAIAPHATSKIQCVDDLMELHSLGFRGEALASISSVSRFSLTSKPSAQEDAAQLTFDELEKPIISAAAHPNGTTIEVRDLFYNVPVRRTFLKSAKTEFLHIELVAKKIALSRFDLSIQLTHNGKTSFKLPCAKSIKDVNKRLSLLLGRGFMDSSHYFKEQRQAYQLKGWLGSPEYLRSQNDIQYIFLNGRMVRDKLLLHAVRKVYEPYLYPGRSACFLLFFELPADEVDVNVHPTKHEVRFQEPRSIHDFFISVLSKALTHMETSKEETSVASISMPAPKSENKIPVQERCYQSAPVKAPSPKESHVAIEPLTSLNGYITPLGAAHGLYIHQGMSFLFNVSDLYQEQLLSRIHQIIQTEKKLASRPVLVPLMIQLTEIEADNFPFERALTYGFNISLMAQNTVGVRSFPVITPHLDIQACVKSMALNKGSFEEMIARSQQLTLSQLSEAEQKSLINYLIEQEQSKSSSNVFKCLSDDKWQEIINEK